MKTYTILFTDPAYPGMIQRITRQARSKTDAKGFVPKGCSIDSVTEPEAPKTQETPPVEDGVKGDGADD